MADNEPVALPPSGGGLDISTPLGLALGFGALLTAFWMEKTGFGRLPDGFLAPFGALISTVMGLVSVLSDLSDVSKLGPSIAVAFIATLYGVGSANLVWLPLGSKLKRKNEQELAGREMMLEGILSIQAGDNPRIVQEKL